MAGAAATFAVACSLLVAVGPLSHGASNVHKNDASIATHKCWRSERLGGLGGNASKMIETIPTVLSHVLIGEFDLQQSQTERWDVAFNAIDDVGIEEPLGRQKIAQRFIAGNQTRDGVKVPPGTKEIANVTQLTHRTLPPQVGLAERGCSPPQR